MRYTLLIAFIVFGAWMNASGQIKFSAKEEPYFGDELSIKLNDWDLTRNDYTDASFSVAINIDETTFKSSSKQFNKNDGYINYLYDFEGCRVIITSKNLNVSPGRITAFYLIKPTLSFNGITVGDSILKVSDTFYRYFIKNDRVSVYYEDTEICFYYSNGLITKITYLAQQ